MALTPQVSSVIFYLDGTLLDTERATRDILNEFLVTYGKVPHTEEEKGVGADVQGVCYWNHHRLRATADCRGVLAGNIPVVHQKCSPGGKRQHHFQELKRFVKHLHKNGVPLALASNPIRRNVDHKILKLEDWKACFSVILDGDQVPHGKPSPDIFLEAAKRLGVNPSCLVIEDSL